MDISSDTIQQDVINKIKIIIDNTYQYYASKKQLNLYNSVLAYFLRRQGELLYSQELTAINGHKLGFDILTRVSIDNVSMLALITDPEVKFDFDKYYAFGVIKRLDFINENRDLLKDNHEKEKDLKANYDYQLIKYPSLKGRKTPDYTTAEMERNIRKRVTKDYNRFRHYANKTKQPIIVKPKDLLDARVHGNPLDFVVQFDKSLKGDFVAPRFFKNEHQKLRNELFLASLFYISQIKLTKIKLVRNLGDSVSNAIFKFIDDNTVK